MEASPRVRKESHTGLEDHNLSRRINVSTNPTVHPYEGDNALWCLLGVHDYDHDQCRYCQRRNTQVTYKPAQE